MLELRPNCEWCDCDLPPESLSARVCSYECTYCATCVDTILQNVCPTCGGDFSTRPLRPFREWRPGSRLGRSFDPASTARRYSRWTAQEVGELSQRLRGVPPEER
ncbi:DUF1272 domain-containing protein [Mesorhizobium sp. M0050]|uniref:DUF1272 domain-containing protein n=1 Tax=unclassified Mesorhizobium TaxID=325217 RepID=UPI00333E1860